MTLLITGIGVRSGGNYQRFCEQSSPTGSHRDRAWWQRETASWASLRTAAKTPPDRWRRTWCPEKRQLRVSTYAETSISSSKKKKKNGGRLLPWCPDWSCWTKAQTPRHSAAGWSWRWWPPGGRRPAVHHRKNRLVRSHVRHLGIHETLLKDKRATQTCTATFKPLCWNSVVK